MALAWLGSDVKQGYSSILWWNISSNDKGFVRYQDWDLLCVLGPKPWFARWGQKLLKSGYSEQFARRSRLNLGGKLLTWIQRLLQSVSVSVMSWEMIESMEMKRRQKHKKEMVLQAMERGREKEGQNFWLRGEWVERES